MKVYDLERKAGLEEAIAQNTSLAFETKASLVDEKLVGKAISHFLSKATNQNQIDLHYLKSVLVSAGWNLNDDVFSVEHLWISRHTPEDKPFNLEHNEKDIIGHITGNYVVDAEGNEISEAAEINSLPPVIQIVTNAVLYAHWDNPELQARMAKIIAEIVNGEYFVSMECLFDDFDYALTSLDSGSQKVIARNDQSSFLTKHLRVYGGNGEFNRFKIGRILKNIVFSGKGLVKRPANPKSTIDEVVPFGGAVASLQETVMENKAMSAEVDMKAYQALATERDALKAKVDELGEKQVKAKLDAAAEEVKAHKTKADELASKLVEVEAAKKDMEDKYKMGDKVKCELETKLADVTKAFDALKVEQLKAKRVASLKDVGLSTEDATAKVEKFFDISDAAFDEVVALAKTNFEFFKKDEDKKKKEEEAKKGKGGANAGILDTAKPTDDTNLAQAGITNETENSAVAALASWYENVIKTSKK